MVAIMPFTAPFDLPIKETLRNGAHVFDIGEKEVVAHSFDSRRTKTER
jgi:hypothetical protein